MSASSIPSVTEDDIVEFLINTPDFFERHAEVLSVIRLTSPHGNRAVSLSERQTEILREKIRTLELRLMSFIRLGNENDILNQRLLALAESILGHARSASHLPQQITHELAHRFLVPQVCLKLWGLQADHANLPQAQDVSQALQDWVKGLSQPTCGQIAEPSVRACLPIPDEALSLAAVPLQYREQVFGVLLLASPDPQRFGADMGIDLLQQLGRLTASSLASLLATA